jgi:hypothetical protein
MFDYVICFYFGPRRGQATGKIDRYYYIKKHYEFVKKHKSKLKNIVFVLNGVDLNDDIYREVKELVPEEYLMPRENYSGSYGAWNDAIVKIIDNAAPHILICEDDYLPEDCSFEVFRSEFDSGIIYVCQLYAKLRQTVLHPAISKGLISSSKAKDIISNTGCLFHLNHKGRSYQELDSLQMSFTSHFPENSIKALDQYRHRFKSCIDGIIEYGTLEAPEVIKPL